MDITFINLTPHSITVRDVGGEAVVFPASGVIARVGTYWTEVAAIGNFKSYEVSYTGIEGLPSMPGDNEMFIVSAMVMEAAKAANHPLLRHLVAPATGHAGVERNDKGHIVSVPGFVRA